MTTQNETAVEFKLIAYWKDGYHDDDIEGAKLIDTLDAFGCGNHELMEVPTTANNEQVQKLVNDAINSPGERLVG